MTTKAATGQNQLKLVSRAREEESKQGTVNVRIFMLYCRDALSSTESNAVPTMAGPAHKAVAETVRCVEE